MTTFILKIIALASMIIDHMGSVFPQYFGLEFRVIGRVAFPIFVYLLAEGFKHTRSPYKFLVRLGIFAMISEPFFDLALRVDWQVADYADMRYLLDHINFFASTNIFYTLFLGGVAICGFDYASKWKQTKLPGSGKPTALPEQGAVSSFIRKHNLEIFAAGALIVAALFLAEFLSTDYASYGVAFILVMYVITNKKIRLAVMAVMCVWQHSMTVRIILQGHAGLLDPLFILMIPATLVPVLLVAFYNGKRGPSFKMFFYAAYPAHLAVLFFIAAARGLY